MIDKKQARNHLRQMKKDICRQIKILRQSKQLSFEDLSRESGIPIIYLERFESGSLEINIGTLNQIARFFDKKLKIELADY